MTNEERNRLIVSVNEALAGGMPERIRSVSAEFEKNGVKLQFIHDGELNEMDCDQINIIEGRLAAAMQIPVDHELVRVDAPGAYSSRLLSVVILAMFEQNENVA